jgi:hypothetical protein
MQLAKAEVELGENGAEIRRPRGSAKSATVAYCTLICTLEIKTASKSWEINGRWRFQPTPILDLYQLALSRLLTYRVTEVIGKLIFTARVPS